MGKDWEDSHSIPRFGENNDICRSFSLGMLIIIEFLAFHCIEGTIQPAFKCIHIIWTNYNDLNWVHLQLWFSYGKSLQQKSPENSGFRKNTLPGSLTVRPWKWMVGRLLTFWEGGTVKLRGCVFLMCQDIMDLEKNGCFLKWWYPQIVHFNRVFHYFRHPFWDTPIFGHTQIEFQWPDRSLGFLSKWFGFFPF